MSSPKISVIVPVYNVEPYLRRCLDSITGQTYGNLEIILVDDGSADGSGAICDEYAARDSRIRASHQPNGGVSSARNAGLASASGEWIGWVDSDDWIEPEMYERLLGRALGQGADIAVCGRLEHHRNRLVPFGWDQETLLDREEAMELLLRNEVVQSYLCDKLWRRELFAGITFPEGRTFEDIQVMHRLFARAQRVVCLPDIMYHYIQRSGSIVADQSLQNRLDHYRALKLRMDELYSQWPQFQHLLEAQCAASAIMTWCACCKSPRAQRERFSPQLEEIAQFSQKHARDALAHMRLGLAGRMVLRLTRYNAWWSFALAGAVSWAYSLKHGRGL